VIDDASHRDSVANPSTSDLGGAIPPR
jgi:hypothetical protein